MNIFSILYSYRQNDLLQKLNEKNLRKRLLEVIGYNKTYTINYIRKILFCNEPSYDLSDYIVVKDEYN
ncbi:MAG: hypothetical protein ACTSWR_08290, partial [Candidatus Helarchaeota archaeon]